MMAIKGFPHSQRANRRYAQARSRIAARRRHRFQAQDRRVGASLRLSSCCLLPSPTITWAAVAPANDATSRQTSNGASTTDRIIARDLLSSQSVHIMCMKNYSTAPRFSRPQTEEHTTIIIHFRGWYQCNNQKEEGGVSIGVSFCLQAR
jgi:hypothetical protein